MPFDDTMHTVLENYINQHPHTEDAWHVPWTAILTTFFPPAQRYMVSFQRRPDNLATEIPALTFAVEKSTTVPFYRTVVIVAIKNTDHWHNSGISALQRQLNRQINTVFNSTAHSKVYWIEAIGPHWRYGEKGHGEEDVRPLIDWHDIPHDQASFDDLQSLAHLVANL